MKRFKWLKITLLILTGVIIMGAVCLNFRDWFIHPVFSREAKTRHLVVISVDSLNAKDFEYISTLPNFKKLIDFGSYAREVVGVYPSLTYPSHTSIITGVYPDRHGISANELFQPGKAKQDWYWYKKYIRVPTLYDIARNYNLRVGAILWPVTAGAKIDYNLPEIIAKEGESQTWTAIRNGSPLFLADLKLRFGKMLNGTKQPELDNFAAASACYTIRSKKPNLMLIHLTDLDHSRHVSGLMSKQAMEALKRQDERIGQIIQSVIDAGIYEETTFMVLGDHGFLDVQYAINPNIAFRKSGLISTDNAGNVTDWKAYANSSDGSAYIILKDSEDDTTRKKVEEILNSLSSGSDSSVEIVYDKEDTLKLKTGSGADYTLEARKGYCFKNDWLGEDIITKVDPGKSTAQNEVYVAYHGFSPSKTDYRTFFLAAGSGVKKGVMIPQINIVDEGPTMASILGLNMKDTDGRVLKEIIE